MQKDIFNIIKAAQAALGQLDNGNLYTSAYVAERFVRAADEKPNDILINSMRDVIVKKASSSAFMSQSDVKSIYDQMLGLGGNRSAFRTVLGDLLPEERQYLEKKHENNSHLKATTGAVAMPYKNKELSDAFEVVLDLNRGISNKKNRNLTSSVKKAVVSALSGIGYAPRSIDVIAENDHFALCAAIYSDGYNKVALHLPVQITNGLVNPPSSLTNGETTIPLTKDNVWLAIKEAKEEKKYYSQKKVAGRREPLDSIPTEKKVLPQSLDKFANLENDLMMARASHDDRILRKGMVLVSNELKGLGFFNPQVKFGSSSQTGVVYSAEVPTVKGHVNVRVPVEIHNGQTILPSKFYTADNVYDFSKAGYDSFNNRLNTSASLGFDRERKEMGDQSYHQLMDQLLEGVASKNYKKAENALMVIQRRFEKSHYVSAFKHYQDLLKHSSAVETDRTRHIKVAIERGDLIKHPTTVQWYCPKLALPLSKIAFDAQGRPMPMHRLKSQNADSEQVMINTSNIKIN